MHKTHRGLGRPPFERITLLLQGGGALGAYQGGVYQALAEADIHPDWVAGISIGAINAALIAGNPVKQRVARLREFWETVTEPPDLPAFPLSAIPFPAMVSPWELGDTVRGFASQLSAGMALLRGANGFFRPRPIWPWLAPPGTAEATSYYDTAELRATLERLTDFDRINAPDGTRLSVGAVNVRSGNFVYFDTATHTIRTDHVMASGALPPGFPAIEIEGEYYWDGGLVSNTPLTWVLDSVPQCDTLCFQIDLWSARGEFPRSMAEVLTRQKEIQFSSRTRANSDRARVAQTARHAIAELRDVLPEEVTSLPQFQPVAELGVRSVYAIVQLIYRARDYEGQSKDYEFSAQSMDEHWRAGYDDTVRTLRHPQAIARPRNAPVATFDVHVDGSE